MLASLVVGFVGGWAARSTVDSPRGLAIRSFAALYGTRARLQRWATVERERIADLLAEVRSHYDLQDLEASRGASLHADNLP